MEAIRVGVLIATKDLKSATCARHRQNRVMKIGLAWRKRAIDISPGLKTGHLGAAERNIIEERGSRRCTGYRH
jgi:hypothetical protein